jgi:hypothetical protein
VGDDGFLLCGRRTGPQDGFVFLGQARGDAQFSQYRRADDPHLRDQRPTPVSGSGTSIDWAARVRMHAEAFTPEQRQKLAHALGLPEAALCAVAIGYISLGPHRGESGERLGPCWTFPEVNGRGEVIGLTCRYASGEKKAWPRASRGLTVPAGWRDRDGPVLCVEGPSDVLALTAIGLAAIGRPNNTGGAELLAELLADLSPDRPVIVLGELDPKVDGTWPGRDGAAKVAGELAVKIGRSVFWRLAPWPAKDVRDWVLSRKLDPCCADEWDQAGQALLAELEKKRQKAEPATERQAGFVWRPIDSASFAGTTYRAEWLVRRLLVRGQPAVVGGPKKVLKTSLLVDLAISLASGGLFLGEFEVYRCVRVAVLSAESGEITLQETARRVCWARGLDLAEIGANLLWQFDLPQLASIEQLQALHAGLAENQVEVVILDPLYLALLAGGGPGAPRAENMFETGPLLRTIARHCLIAGATPILAHHTRHRSGTLKEPIDLDDLAYSGIAEFARQWMLLSRRETYEAGTGSHRLWLNAGGSCGQGGLWAVDIEEGAISEDFIGRRWEVSVATATQSRAALSNERQDQRTRQQDERNRIDDCALLDSLNRLDPQCKGVSQATLKGNSLLSRERFSRACARLVQAGRVEQCDVTIRVGNGAERPARGLRLRTSAHASEHASGHMSG